MGWTGYYTAPRDPKAEIARLCTYETEDRKVTPARICKKGSTFYVAVRVQMKDPAADVRDFKTDLEGVYTFAAVFLTSYRVEAWGYKDMDETMGPAVANAPQSLLTLLSDTTNKYAIEWREKCRANAALSARKVADGDVIRLTHPITFADDRERSTFRIEIQGFAGRRNITRFICTETGARCRLTGFKTLAWEHVAEEAEGAGA